MNGWGQRVTFRFKWASRIKEHVPKPWRTPRKDRSLDILFADANFNQDLQYLLGSEESSITITAPEKLAIIRLRRSRAPRGATEQLSDG
jgi:hypothetical protein